MELFRVGTGSHVSSTLKYNVFEHLIAQDDTNINVNTYQLEWDVKMKKFKIQWEIYNVNYILDRRQYIFHTF